jgi:phytoene dehydrogenase-like protein
MRSAGAGADRALRRFVDLQLLITMQCEADRCVALNGALALELYRFGVFWVDGGPAGAARALADAFIAHGGALRLRTRAACLEPEGDRWRVRTADGASVLARAVVLGVPLAAARALLGTRAPALLSWRSRHLPPSWGAVVLAAAVEPPPEGSPALPLYRQTVESWDRDLAEGESAFVSLYPPDERGPGARDATGLRLTVSAHTRAARWWRLATSDRTAYLAEKARVGERLMAAAERALPWIRGRIRYREVAAPPTFARYTGRPSGGVGGIPQTRGAANLLAWPTRAGVPGVYLCGDTTFPGQGTIGATLSGVNAWRAVLDDDG